ncbi:DUF4234 domain-containing protein [Kitasatospora sp. NPDC051914]|uniref:DUF4234 domain-containing protein n=1 Tax=Kitasatospora sp. NPDC051914 TaxID=3154945 RepID=UPI00344AD006
MARQIGKNRNIFLVWLVWPLLTLGVYHFVWWYKINREVGDFDDQIDVNPTMSVIAILFGWIIIVPPFVSIYNTGQRIATMQRDTDLTPTCNPWLGLLLSFFFGLHALYYQSELNAFWDRSRGFAGKTAYAR